MELSYAIKNLKGSPAEIPDCSRDDLPKLFIEMGFKVGAEIGVCKGEYTEKFCELGLEMNAIDPWMAYGGYENSSAHQNESEINYKTTVDRLSKYTNCKIIKKNSMDASSDFKNNSLDFVYIDGNHDFKHVAQDIYEWTNKIKSGGIVAGHDYTYFRAKSLLGVCDVIPVVNAYTSAFNINNWYVIGRKNAPVGERRDRWRSWMFVKP